MRVIELRAEKFKRLKAVRIQPDPTLAVISGRNGAGKSSVLDAIQAALGGKDAAPQKPVLDGADKATVVLDLGDILVTRKFSADGKSTLVVESKDGARYPSPQSVLDAAVGQLNFDPLEFSRMDPKKQAQMLRTLVGLDTSKLDAERKKHFESRTDVNRDVTKLKGQLAGMPEVDAPDEEVSLSDLAKEHKAASDQHAANERVRRDHRDAVHHATACKVAVEEAQRRLADAQERLSRAEADVDIATMAIRAIAPLDFDAIAAKMQTAEQTNGAVRAKKARAAKAAELEARESAAAKLTKAIADIDAAKAKALDGAKFPVPGLSVDDDVVTMNGVPFSQASSAEQLRCCLAIGAALNPKLRLIIVRDGSLLDSDGMRLVAEWAEANDMQVVMERVTDGDVGVGVVIEDGEVVEADAAEDSPPAAVEAPSLFEDFPDPLA
jgi:DNA repair exonuclease SbcCD ATPase subunit